VDQQNREKEKLTREQLIEELRRRYQEGTLDEILIPENADVDGLMDDIFPDGVPEKGGT